MSDNNVDPRSLAGENRLLPVGPAGGGLMPVDGFLKVVVLAVAYFLTGWLGLLVAIPPGYATAVWPPSGIALAGLIGWGPRVWPGIWLGSFLVNVWISLAGPNAELNFTGLVVAGSIAIGSTLQALLGAFLLQRWLGAGRLFERGTAILAFAAIEALSCLLAATWGVTSLCLAGFAQWASYWDSWRTWWLGDLVGVLVVTPLILAWRALPHWDLRPWHLAEVIGSGALLAVMAGIVFAGPLQLGGGSAPLAFMPLPILVWIAFRFDAGGVAVATSLLSGIAITATSHGSGPFVRDVTNESLLLLQAFSGLATLTGLTVAAAVTGHKQAEQKIRRLNVELEQRVRERTAELEELTRHLEALSLTDPLTGLANRRALERKLDEAVLYAVRYRVPLSLLLLDADQFKAFNDSFGHPAGDEVLQEIGRLLRQHSRDTDFAVRHGGEEFAVLLQHTDREGALVSAERLRRAVETAPWSHRAVTVSIGIMTLAPSGMGSATLMAEADKALYEAKRRGRNCVVHASGDLS